MLGVAWKPKAGNRFERKGFKTGRATFLFVISEMGMSFTGLELHGLGTSPDSCALTVFDESVTLGC